MTGLPLLLVEGVNDRHVVGNLLRQHGLVIDVDFLIRDKRGVDPLVATLPIEIKARGLAPLGVIVDADTDLQARWDSLNHLLTKLGYGPPRSPEASGLVVVQADSPPIGVWVMPDNQIPGKLEDFVARLAPDQDAILPMARQATLSIPTGLRRFSEADTAKAVIHNWLAWQEEPGSRMGEAFTKQYLDPKAPTALLFVEWVRRLIAARPTE
jgi:hypothetical protein